MLACRLLLIVVMAVLVDLGSPLVSEAGQGMEEFEEAAHGRRRLPPVRAAAAVPVVGSAVTVAVPRPTRHRPPVPSRPAPVRKIPLRPAPPSASDDH